MSQSRPLTSLGGLILSGLLILTQAALIAIRLDDLSSWSWVQTLAPLWVFNIVFYMGGASLLILRIRSSVSFSLKEALSVLVFVLLLSFELLLVLKLDKLVAWPYWSICIPLILVELICTFIAIVQLGNEVYVMYQEHSD